MFILGVVVIMAVGGFLVWFLRDGESESTMNIRKLKMDLLNWIAPLYADAEIVTSRHNAEGKVIEVDEIHVSISDDTDRQLFLELPRRRSYLEREYMGLTGVNKLLINGDPVEWTNLCDVGLRLIIVDKLRSQGDTQIREWLDET